MSDRSVVRFCRKKNEHRFRNSRRCTRTMAYLRESVLDDGGQLLAAVGREVKKLRSAVRLRLQSGQNTVSQVESVRDT